MFGTSCLQNVSCAVMLATLLISTASQSCFSTSFSLSAFFSSLTLSLHGKWTTGITKKLLLLSAIPASILYHAKKAAIIPNAPPALVRATFAAPSTLATYALPSIKYVNHTKSNSEENATVDFSVQVHKMKVNMNQPNMYSPNALANSAVMPPYASAIAKPPGVKTMPKDIQKPP